MKTPQTKNAIGLSNGDFFNYDSPETHDYDIEAIAQSLSKICRFNGHNDGDAHYSVAEHSVLVSRTVPPEYALEGLLHDASEAFTGDIQKPLKEKLPCFKKIEDRVEKAVATFFNLRYPFPSEIKQADKAVYQAERQQIATAVHDSIWNKGVPPANVKIRCLSPKRAKREFLERFEELRNAQERIVGEGSQKAAA
jgi:5'-deoxynucleotidase YfbR-like HD superfamily hydrolase